MALPFAEPLDFPQLLQFFAARAISGVEAVDGRVDFARAPGEVVSSLQEVHGIASWTDRYVAPRALGDPDAFPAADVVLLRWRPWRGYAAQYLWHSASASENSQSRSTGRRMIDRC